MMQIVKFGMSGFDKFWYDNFDEIDEIDF